MSKEKKCPNFEYIGNGFYIVRTQAGFVQASRHFIGEDYKKNIVDGYPKKYPSVVTFAQRYNGLIRYTANCIPFRQLRADMQLSDETAPPKKPKDKHGKL